MSRRRFVHQDIEVLTGYDRPLDYFWLVIDRVSGATAAHGRPLFSNLDRKNPGMTLDEIKQTLAQYQIESPGDLLEDLVRDQHAEQLFPNLTINIDYERRRQAIQDTLRAYREDSK